jgi:hypothetical protein
MQVCTEYVCARFLLVHLTVSKSFFCIVKLHILHMFFA